MEEDRRERWREVEIAVRGEGNYASRTDCFLPGNTMGVMGGCCGQTFRPRLQTRRKKTWFSGVWTLSWEVLGSTSRRLQAQYIILFAICREAVKAAGLPGLCAADCPGYVPSPHGSGKRKTLTQRKRQLLIPAG